MPKNKELVIIIFIGKQDAYRTCRKWERDVIARSAPERV
jgi:hypothetical protein